MTRRATSTHSIDAHDSTKELLKRAAERSGGRHRGGHAPAGAEAHLLPGPGAVHRARKPRPTMPKM